MEDRIGSRSMKTCGLGMSNFDHSIDQGLEEALRARPGEVFGRYAGWNFNALVFFDNGAFHADVWQYKSIADHVSEPTLKELMESISNLYGWD